MKFTIYQNSRQGPRNYNQDRLAYSYSKDALLLVLADGMGGHRNGEIAAQLAVKTLTDIQRGYLYCAHVGDSRLYHFRDGHLLFRTEDHSVVQSMFKKGMITQEDMATHPYKNKIYNCLGGDTPPQIDLADRYELIEGDTVLLCTDGVWGVLADHQIKDIIEKNAVIADATTQIMDSAELASDERGDNLSAIGLQWGDRASSIVAVSTQLMPLGETTTIINTVTHQPDGSDPAELSDSDIENTIAAIQKALNKTVQKTRN